MTVLTLVGAILVVALIFIALRFLLKQTGSTIDPDLMLIIMIVIVLIVLGLLGGGSLLQLK